MGLDWLVSVIVVSICLPSDALSQRLPSYWGFSYLGHGVSLHGCSSKVQPLPITLGVVYRQPLLTLGLRYLLSASHCSSTAQPLTLDVEYPLSAAQGSNAALPPLATYVRIFNLFV